MSALLVSPLPAELWLSTSFHADGVERVYLSTQSVDRQFRLPLLPVQFPLRFYKISSCRSCGVLFSCGPGRGSHTGRIGHADNLTSHFKKYGEITDAVIMKDRNTGHPRGFGFVTFADPAVCDRVVEDKHVIDGRTVRVSVLEASSDLFLLCLCLSLRISGIVGFNGLASYEFNVTD